MSKKVKNCPFCGGAGAIFRENEQVDETHIYCMRCYSHTQTYASQEKAISMWNRVGIIDDSWVVG